MRNIYLFIILGLYCTVASAQSKARFGLKAGLNVASQVIKPISGGKSSVEGLSFMGFTDIPLWKKFCFEPGLSLQEKGVKLENGNLYSAYGGTLEMTYLEMPLNLLVKFPMGGSANFIIGGGPYLAFGLDGDMHYDNGSKREHVFKSNAGSNGYEHTDYGLNLLAGTEWGPHFLLNVQYSTGLANVAPEPYLASIDYIPGHEPQRSTMRNRVGSVSLGYKF